MTQPLIYPGGQVAASTPLTGAELITIDAGGAVDSYTTAAAIAALAGTETTTTKITALNTVGAGIITAAGIVGKITSRGGAQTLTPFSDTTDSAANIILAMPAGAPNGSSFAWRYENNTNAPATLLAGATVTLAGAIIIPAGCWLEYLVVKTSGTVVTITSLTGGQMGPLPNAKFSGLTSTQLGAPTSTVTVGSLTGAEQVTLSISGTVGPYNLQMPGAVELFNSVPNAQAGFNYTLIIQNLKSTTAAATVVTGSGITLNGTATIAQNAARMFNVSLDSATAATVTSIGAMSL